MLSPSQVIILLVTPRAGGVALSAKKLRQRLPDEFLIAGPFAEHDTDLIERALSSMAADGLVAEDDGWTRTIAGDERATELRWPRWIGSHQLPGDEYRSAEAFLKVCGAKFDDDQLERYVLAMGFACLVQMLPVLAGRLAAGRGPSLAELVADFVAL